MYRELYVLHCANEVPDNVEGVDDMYYSLSLDQHDEQESFSPAPPERREK